MKRIKTYCIWEKFNRQQLEKELENLSLIKFNEFIIIDKKDSKFFFFPYWVIISWNSSYDNDKEILEKSKKFIINPHPLLEDEYFLKENKSFQIINDTFYLPNNEKLLIAISHALAQSIKLNYFEKEVEKEIIKTKNIPQEIKNHWTSKLSQKETLKLKWEILLAKSLLNLHYDLLYEPKFFWDHPELVNFYEKTNKYLDLDERISTLNKKLNVLHEIFEVLSDELKYKHETFLERIIIFLFLIEISIAIFHEILKLF